MTLRFCAAPKGNACGLAVGAAGGRLFVVAVEPKLWRQARGSDEVSLNWPADQMTLVLKLHEGQKAVISFGEPAGETDDRRRAVEAAIIHAEQTTDDDDDDDPKTKRPEPLLEELPVRRRCDPTVAHNAASGAADLTPITHVLQLIQRAEASGARTEGHFDAAPSAAMRPLRPLIHLAFVEAVEKERHDIRRGYVAVTQPLAAVRGRILTEGLVRHVATGTMTLLCAFDELTEATPLFRVLMTALRCVAAAGQPASPFDKMDGFSQLPGRALMLTHQLAGIRPLAVAEAARQARTIRLNRATRRWQEALDLATFILREQELLPGAASGKRSAAFSLKIVTPTFWEQILEAALHDPKQGLHVVPRGEDKTCAPWSTLGNDSRPDLLVRVENRLWCIDAKYKLHEGPSKADQYQLFTYSHLARVANHPEPPHACILAYPGPRQGDVESRDPCPRNTFAGAGKNEPALHILRVPFPDRKQVAEPDKWEEYIVKTRKCFAARLTR